MRNINEEKKNVVDYDDGVTRIYPDKKGTVKSKKTKKKTKKESATPFSSKILILVIVAILLLVFLIANASSGGFVSTINGKMVAVLTKNSTEKFDFAIENDDVFSFSAYDNGIAILFDDGITFVDASGNINSRQQLSFNNPRFVERADKFMLFDYGDSSYAFMKNKLLLSHQSVNEDIINAAVSAKNNYAIVVREHNKAKSILYGFNGNGKLIYQWNCADGYIADVAMNKSGSKVAVTVVDAENAVLCSSVYILDFEYDSAYAQFDYADETVIGTKFLSDKKIQVITDKKVYLISSKEQDVIYEYDSSEICYTCVEDGSYTAVVTKSYVLDDSYKLCVFNKSGKLKAEVELSGEVCGLDSSSKSIAVLFKDKTETYSSYGKLVGTTTGLHICEDIVINGNFLYVLSSDSVKKFTAYGNNEAVYVYDEQIEIDAEEFYSDDYEDDAL